MILVVKFDGMLLLFNICLKMKEKEYQKKLIYNKTLGDASSNARGAIAILDFGGDFTVANGTFKIILPTASRSNAIIRID